jgi:MFS family permease
LRADDGITKFVLASLVITVFALGTIIGSPTMTLATLRLPQRRILVLAAGVFSLGHVVVAPSGSFAVVLAAPTMSTSAFNTGNATRTAVAGTTLDGPDVGAPSLARAITAARTLLPLACPCRTLPQHEQVGP